MPLSLILWGMEVEALVMLLAAWVLIRRDRG